MRSLKMDDTPVIEGFRIHYNFARPHESLDSRTRTEVVGQDRFGKGGEGWLKPLLESMIWKVLNNT